MAALSFVASDSLDKGVRETALWERYDDLADSRNRGAMELADLHRRSVESWRSRIDAVDDSQWNLPTPCAEWDVRALVNHVISEELWTVPLVDGATIEEIGDRFDGDLLGDDPVAVARAAATEAAAAVDRRLPEGGTVHLSFGVVPIEEYVQQLSADHLVHSWDLAVATHQELSLDLELVREVSVWFAEREEMYRAAGAVGPAGPAGTDPQSVLLAAFGRVAPKGDENRLGRP